jgi:hypothetical protein
MAPNGWDWEADLDLAVSFWSKSVQQIQLLAAVHM